MQWKKLKTPKYQQCGISSKNPAFKTLLKENEPKYQKHRCVAPVTDKLSSEYITLSDCCASSSQQGD